MNHQWVFKIALMGHIDVISTFSWEDGAGP